MKRTIARINWCLALSLLASSVQATSFDWIGPNGGGPSHDGAFEDSANWNPNSAVPGAGDEANFGINNLYQVGVSSDISVSSLTVSRGDVSLAIDALSSLTVAGPLQIANNNPGNTRLTTTGFTDAQFALVLAGDGDATLAASGADATVLLNDLFLGGTVATSARLNVANGATVVVNNALASDGLSAITVSGGAQLSSGTADIGGASTVNATLQVLGAGSSLSSTSLSVGGEGSGTVSITDGGQVSTGSLTVLDNGQFTLSGSGSGLNITDPMQPLRVDSFLGGGGGASLRIDNGAQFVSDVIEVGLTDAGSTDTVTLSGNTSRWDANFINLASNAGGPGGSARLVVEDGAELFVNRIDFSGGSGGTAVVDVLGGRINLNNYLDLGGFGTTDATLTVTGPGAEFRASDMLSVGGEGTGTLSISDGGLVEGRTLSIIDNGSVSLSGAGSQLLVTDASTPMRVDSFLGAGGGASLRIDNGAQFVSDVIEVGLTDAGSTDSVTLSGNATRWDANFINLASNAGGPGGSARLLVEDGAELFASRIAFSDVGGGTAVMDVLGGRVELFNYLDLGGFTNTDATLTVSGPGAEFRANDMLSVGGEGTGTLSISDGGLVEGRTLSIIDNGSVSLSGAGSQLLVTDASTPMRVDSFLGAGVGASLQIDNGAQFVSDVIEVGLTDAGSTDSVTLSGNTTRWDANVINLANNAGGPGGDALLTVDTGAELNVGRIDFGGSSGGIATVDVFGGRINQVSSLDLGAFASTDATLTVAGAGAEFRGSNLSIGGEGNGSLTIRDGGLVEGSRLSIIDNGQFTLSGAASQLILTDNLTPIRVDSFLGAGSGASLRLENGAQLATDVVEVGLTNSGSTDTVTVSGNATRWDGNIINLANGAGLGGDALLVVEDGAEVNVNRIDFGGSNGGLAAVSVSSAGRLNVVSNLRIGEDVGTNASLSITGAGSTVDNSGSLTVVGGGGTGIIDLGIGGTLIADFVDIRQGGSIVGSGSVEGDLLINGLAAPGNSPGLLDVGGDLILGGLAVTEIEIGGLIPATEFDVIDVRDNLVLDGLLSVTFINGFAPVAGDSFAFLLFGGTLSGQFADIQYIGAPQGVDLDLLFGANGIEVVASLPSAAPVPGTPLLMLLALVALLRLRAAGGRARSAR